MIKTSIRKTLLLSLSLSFILGSTVMASGMSTDPMINYSKEMTCTNPKKCREHRKGQHYLRAASFILMNKYNVKPEDIAKAKEEGKTIFDIAKSKGLSTEELKAMVIAPRFKALDEMAVTGEMSKEKVETIKAKIKESVEKWDGKIEDIKPTKKIMDKAKRFKDKKEN